VQLWTLGNRAYAGKWQELGENATVVMIREALEDIVNCVNDAVVDIYGRKHDDCQVIWRIYPRVTEKDISPYSAMVDPLSENRVYMTVGYKAWIEREENK